MKHNTKQAQKELEIEENKKARMARMIRLLEMARDLVSNGAPADTINAAIGEAEAAARKEQRNKKR